MLLKDVKNTKKQKKPRYLMHLTPRCASLCGVELCGMHPTTESSSGVCISSRSQAPRCASHCGVKLGGVHHTAKSTAPNISKNSAVCITAESDSAVCIPPRSRAPLCAFHCGVELCGVYHSQTAHCGVFLCEALVGLNPNHQGLLKLLNYHGLDGKSWFKKQGSFWDPWQ